MIKRLWYVCMVNDDSPKVTTSLYAARLVAILAILIGFVTGGITVWLLK